MKINNKQNSSTHETEKPRRYKRTSDAVLRHLAGEHLLVPIRSGKTLDAELLYILDEVGAKVWDSLSEAKTLKELIDAVCEEFEVREEHDVEGDLAELVGDLIEQGLAVVEDVL